jgi:Flp pilus assembly CpaF family ATPase
MNTTDILDVLLQDGSVTEIMINGTSSIYVEKEGKLLRENRHFENETTLYNIIDNILTPLGKNVTRKSPYADARLADGSRVNIVIPPASVNGPLITIRRFPEHKRSVAFLTKSGSSSLPMLRFLQLAVELKKNIIISGGTGTGKTTLLNILASYIGNDERIVTIEDTAELQLSNEHVGRLEACAPDNEGNNGITIRQLLINALRMRPDRLIIGECRGGEALDMLQAMNTGHSGSMSSVHANTPRDCLKRLETMVLMSGYDLPIRVIREQIASAINILIQMTRCPDGSRKITSISEITGMEGDIITIAPLFELIYTAPGQTHKTTPGMFRSTHTIPACVEEAKAKGINVDLSIFS